MGGIGGLESKRCTNRIRHSSELGDKCIASILMGDPAMAGDGFRESPESILNALVGERLIQLDECSRANYIGVQDVSELTCRLFSHEYGNRVVSRWGRHTFVKPALLLQARPGSGARWSSRSRVAAVAVLRRPPRFRGSVY